MPNVEQLGNAIGKVSRQEQELLAYIKREFAIKKGACVFLPSILALASLLNCSAIDVHDVLLNMIQKGYKMLSLSMDAPITLWSPLG